MPNLPTKETTGPAVPGHNRPTGEGVEYDNLGRITSPVLYLAADGDIVPLEHTVAMFRATPGSQLAIVEHADHRLPQNRVDEVAAIVERFLKA